MPGNWFWFIMLVGLTVAIWEAVGAIEVAVIMADILMAIFWGKLPAAVYPIIFLTNVFVFAKALFFKPIAPQIQQ